eukprot:TRINITY_DN10925_c0_g1_i2.p2 TRINITY_DN10925_c0_g1~~TRINITY_DN10925_c0_g1_i2.p2  ORF type:complete len:145 (-),score=11.91 TRINITY_DN10925_c0_g1_i2:247-681(-)
MTPKILRSAEGKRYVSQKESFLFEAPMNSAVDSYVVDFKNHQRANEYLEMRTPKKDTDANDESKTVFNIRDSVSSKTAKANSSDKLYNEYQAQPTGLHTKSKGNPLESLILVVPADGIENPSALAQPDQSQVPLLLTNFGSVRK